MLFHKDGDFDSGTGWVELGKSLEIALDLKLLPLQAELAFLSLDLFLADDDDLVL